MQHAFVNLRTGRPSKLQPPVPGSLPPNACAMLDDVLSCNAVGGPGTVRESLHAFIKRTGADELMITSQIHDHAARMKPYEITARGMQLDPLAERTAAIH
jgi:alkanesulfonate monooxygenase SsuD/methylene tetrahydromethanopterin reductase-like flavin-dependent oxidoreductase (luciferase family)